MNKTLNQFFIIFTLICILFSCSNRQKNKIFKLKEGDLLFQNTGTDEIDNAIKGVTATAVSKNYSHVGMAMKENNKWFVIEAIPKKGISKTSIKEF